MNKSSANVFFGFAIGGVLGIVLVILRLTGVTDWSWWAITAPFWGTVSGSILNYLAGELMVRLFKSESTRYNLSGLSSSVNLGLVFIVLKLLNVIDWGWGAVTSPIWISAIISAIVLIVYLIVKAARGQKRPS